MPDLRHRFLSLSLLFLLLISEEFYQLIFFPNEKTKQFENSSSGYMLHYNYFRLFLELGSTLVPYSRDVSVPA